MYYITAEHWYTAHIPIAVNDSYGEDEWFLLSEEIALVQKAWPSAKIELDKDVCEYRIGYNNLAMAESCARMMASALTRYPWFEGRKNL